MDISPTIPFELQHEIPIETPMQSGKDPDDPNPIVEKVAVDFVQKEASPAESTEVVRVALDFLLHMVSVSL